MFLVNWDAIFSELIFTHIHIRLFHVSEGLGIPWRIPKLSMRYKGKCVYSLCSGKKKLVDSSNDLTLAVPSVQSMVNLEVTG